MACASSASTRSQRVLHPIRPLCCIYLIVSCKKFMVALRGRGPDDNPHQQSLLVQLFRKGLELDRGIGPEANIRHEKGNQPVQREGTNLHPSGRLGPRKSLSYAWSLACSSEACWLVVICFFSASSISALAKP